MRWRVTGINADVRKTARDAAKAADLPLGPWLERAILKRIELQEVPASPDDVQSAADSTAAKPLNDGRALPQPEQTSQSDQTPAPEETSLPEETSENRGAIAQPAAARIQLSLGSRRRAGVIAAVILVAATAIGVIWLQPAPPSMTPDSQQSASVSNAEAPSAPSAVGPTISDQQDATPTPDPAARPAPAPVESATPSPGAAPQPAPAQSPPPPSSSPSTPGPAQTMQEIIAELQRDALNGDATAQHDLALAYVNGRGVPQNYEIAAGWFEKAAQAGLERAQFNLAVLYENALGVPQDFKRAFELYNAAAEQGFGPAQHNVAVAYAQGRGTQRDYRAAALWFRRAADQGIVSAQFNLGMIYERGLAGPPDEKTAYGWYRRAAAAGSEAALARLAALEGRIAPGATQPAVGQSPPRAAKPTREEIAELQRLLGQLSFNAGPPDGKAGPTTRDAIRQYEKIAGLKVTGEPTVALLAHLRQVTRMMDRPNR